MRIIHRKATTLRITRVLAIAALAATLASCASKKSMQGSTSLETMQGDYSNIPEHLRTLTFVQKIADNQVYAKNITGDITLTVSNNGKNMTLPGSLRMRKDTVVRLQIFMPILGTELGRIEFTPDYVLVMDRIHKEYVKADYSQVDFLSANGLTFYSLQALFWNQLFLPGKDRVTESSLHSFDADMTAEGDTIPVMLRNGGMTFTWNADKANGRIGNTVVEYNSMRHGTSTLNWQYDNFKDVGSKKFPSQQSFSFVTEATGKRHTLSLKLKMNDIKTESGWTALTTVSSKYKEKDANGILKNILTAE